MRNRVYLVVLTTVVTLVVASQWIAGDSEEVLYPDKQDRTRFRMDLLRERIVRTQDARSIDAALKDLTPEAKQKIVRDGWGNPIRIIYGERMELRSSGPDERFDSPDDIVTEWCRNGRAGALPTPHTSAC
jgi:hypothetical protein